MEIFFVGFQRKSHTLLLEIKDLLLNSMDVVAPEESFEQVSTMDEFNLLETQLDVEEQQSLLVSYAVKAVTYNPF